MLAACSAEGDEDVVGGVEALGDRDGADGLGHALVGEFDEALEEGRELNE